MVILVLGLLLLLGAHSVTIVAPGWRDAAVTGLGEGAYKGLHSVVSLAGLILIVWGFALASEAPRFLYTPPAWGRHLTMLLMIPALILVLVSIFPANGIKRFVRHPLLIGTVLWAIGHLFANGDVAGVVVFGAILAWAVIDRISQPQMPQGGRAKGSFGVWDLAAVITGLALYIVLVAGLHYWLFGVSPTA